MNGRWAARTAAVVLAVVAVGAVAALAWQGGFAAGMAHGMATAAAAAGAGSGTTPEGVPPWMYGYGPWGYGWRPWGFGFGPFGLLGGLLLVALVFGLLRAAFWGGRWRRDGVAGRGPWEGRLRALHDEWHGRSAEPNTSAQ